MGKIIVFNMLTLNGYYVGENDDISWHSVDNEFNDFAVEHTKSFKRLIFGRKTYQLFESFWPGAEVDSPMSKEDKEIGHSINTVKKIVFSRTLKEVLEKPHWQNITLLHDIDSTYIKELKQQRGDMAIFGSGTIVQSFTNLGLIDEYRLMINPVILERGKLLFENVANQQKLKLINTRVFKNGNVLLCYQPS